MNLQEYNKVKDYTYLEYCDYLQDKYGVGDHNYMTKNFNRNPKCTRTNEGLIAHHKYEDQVILLSKKEIAMQCPYEWQEKESLVYCDYLEHLLLHQLICEYPSPLKHELMEVGIGGILNFLCPELNDLYSGWTTKQPWRKNCHDLVRNDKEVYLQIVKRTKIFLAEKTDYAQSNLYHSYSEIMYNGWDTSKNTKIYLEIKNA